MSLLRIYPKSILSKGLSTRFPLSFSYLLSYFVEKTHFSWLNHCLLFQFSNHFHWDCCNWSVFSKGLRHYLSLFDDIFALLVSRSTIDKTSMFEVYKRYIRTFYERSYHIVSAYPTFLIQNKVFSTFLREETVCL